MNTHKVTPKDFFLWAGAMVAFYVSMFSFITLLFQYINSAYPDALDGYVDPYSGTMRFAIASLIVLFPLFLVLIRLIRNDIEKHSEKKDIWVRRWALYLTVFIAGFAVAVDLITLVNSFLGGELSTRFVLKVLVVFLVAGGTFLHFLADVWGYWLIFPKKARTVGWAAGFVVLVTIVAGFFIMGSPTQIRQQKLDDQRVQDLQNIQYQIINYWQQKGSLPDTIDQIEDPLANWQMPVDPVTAQPYAYTRNSPLDFQLCANFETMGSSRIMQPTSYSSDPTIDNWEHEVGQSCFNRSIDPQRYPVFNKSTTTTE